MYDFIDVNEVSGGGILPSEALQINGEYLEHLVPGYRTLSVQGREALSPDVVSFTTGTRDGSRLQNKRYPERIITVQYQLISESNEEFRSAYNTLGRILDVEDAELIFADEPDMFFRGTPCTIEAVDPGRNAVVGEFEILCTDPFKYSVVEFEAEADLEESTIFVDYAGTYKAFPILEVDFYHEDDASGLTGAGDCGYVAFFTEDEKIIQLGDPEEIDGENIYEMSQTLINAVFEDENSWDGQNQWVVNDGEVFDASFVQTGTVGMAVATYQTISTPDSTTATILSTSSKTGNPIMNYKIMAKSTSRTANSVKVTFTITTSLSRSSSYFGYGLGLVGHLYVNGAWKTVTIKKTSAYWSGKSGHTVTLTATVTGLDATANSISGLKFRVSRSDGGGQSGVLAETACNDLPIAPYETKVPEHYCLTAMDFGTGDGWHGATISRDIPADAAGVIGASNFILTYANTLSVETMEQIGAFQVVVSGDDGILAGVSITKVTSGKQAKVQICIHDAIVEEFDLDISDDSFGYGKSTTITKMAGNITVNIAGVAKSYNDDAIAETMAKKVTFGVFQYGTYPTLQQNGLFSAKFVKSNCDTMKDIPNKFSANDVLTADCRNGEILLNGVSTPSLGALGNDWESFVLKPGLNQIGFAYSEWVPAEYAPTLKVRYREVYL